MVAALVVAAFVEVGEMAGRPISSGAMLCAEREQSYDASLGDARRRLRHVGLRRVAAEAAPGDEAPCLDGGRSNAAGLLLETVAAFLDARAIVRALSTSSTWHAVLASDDVWADQCALLWADKLWLPDRFRDLGAMSRMQAYHDSVVDGSRVEITVEELCAFGWHGRMKGCAGGAWTDSDPWWRGEGSDERKYQMAHVRDVPGGTFMSSSKGEGTWHFPTVGCDPALRHPVQSDRIRHARDQREFPLHRTSECSPEPKPKPQPHLVPSGVSYRCIARVGSARASA